MDLVNDVFRVEATVPLNEIIEIIRASGYQAVEAVAGEFKTQEFSVNGPAPKTIQPFLDVAKEEKKFLLVQCSANWCSACKKMHQALGHSPEIREFLLENFISVELDVDMARDAKTWFGTSVIPDS